MHIGLLDDSLKRVQMRLRWRFNEALNSNYVGDCLDTLCGLLSCPHRFFDSVEEFDVLEVFRTK